MPFFDHDGFRLHYLDEPAGAADREAVLLIHGFASSLAVNWVGPGWTQTLVDSGYRVVAIDNRGHGHSSASYETADYSPDRMAGDAAALLDHVGIGRAHVFGYSMGARVSAYLALRRPSAVATLILGGLGSGLVDGVGDWGPIADGLRAADPQSVTHPLARRFRLFADQTRSDRLALAACIETSRQDLTEAEVARIAQPTLIGVGTRDDIAGDPDALAAMMPDATAFAIEGRDHMLAVGDRTFKRRVLDFLAEHPLQAR